MSEFSGAQLPKLRPIDVQPVVYGGQQALLLRDPLHLNDHSMVMPRQLAPLLALCDGTRDAGALRAALMVRFGIHVGVDAVERMLAALDEALLLEGPRFEEARKRVLEEFRAAPFRAPVLAGGSYPGEADELETVLQRYLDTVDGAGPALAGCRGLVTPHIDYARGGPVYARVWKCAADAVRAAELVVLIGTDHSGGPGRITLTRQHYATPFGILPTAQDLVDELAGAVGPEQVFGEELHHRTEHSIELAAVWLHHMRAGKPCELVPVLCGSFAHFVRSEAEPVADERMGQAVQVLRQAITGRNALVIAAADLAHVGPAFGGQPVDVWGRARLQAADEEIIDRVSAGDAEGFFQAIRRVEDRWNVCGLPPIYLALRVMEPVRGQQVAYERCPADKDGTSLVSICGMGFW
jgi:AmmeMemoRadiSam system protein B